MKELTRFATLAVVGTVRIGGDDFVLAIVIVIGMLKGGTAKTTSAWFIALYYAVVLGKRTLFLDADAASQSGYDWFKVAKADGFEIPENLTVERYPFEDIADYIREKRKEYDAIVVDVGGGNRTIFHEAVTVADRLIVPVAPHKIETRKLAATFTEAEAASARNDREVTAHVVLVKCDDRTSLPRNALEKLLAPDDGSAPFPVTKTKIHSWVHYIEAFGEIPTELSEYSELMKELNA
ncbi:ParA family protein [Streptomyces albipurpureus]|uniref:ParA family protein n=1 Tax=Streptomyces albipurpureus TaxID=2897419 RepID=A0ABT0URB2_9ACTN|nr:ParA family protein [Streptomyces sp. CWNU-1]MCM2390974.1 ParA family protein [Streptomyces sp. CWNU-1]